MELEHIQNGFADGVYRNDPWLTANVRGAGTLTAEQALGIYQNNTQQSLMALMEQTFPVCAKLVGETCFNSLAHDYVAANPSQDQAIEYYGQYFAAAISAATDHNSSLRKVMYLSDMARVEWQINRAYFAANKLEFDFNLFADIAASQRTQIRFMMAPGVAVVKLHWPIVRLWQMHQPGYKVEQIVIKSKMQYALIDRIEYRPYLVSIERPMYQLLDQVFHADTLVEIVDGLPDADKLLAEAIKQRWIEHFYV